MTKKRALTLTVIFKALSGNYGENVGNISELKKLTHGGKSYSFISRQTLRYELWRFLKEDCIPAIDTDEYWREILEKYRKKLVLSFKRKRIDEIISDILATSADIKDSELKKLGESKDLINKLQDFQSTLTTSNEESKKLVEEWKKLLNSMKLDSTDNIKGKLEKLRERFSKLKKLLEDDFEAKFPPKEILHADKEVVQFLPEVNAINCVEADLFGYMKTESGSTASTRSAVVRFSPAVALEPMSFDVEFGTNKNFADRAGSDPNPFQFEHHYSLYSYTLTVDLDRLGAEFNRKGEKLGEVPVEEKLRRLEMVLEGIKFLRREIKGRIENLSPLFAVGGFYSVKNPFFLGRVEVSYNKETGKFRITPELIKEALNLSFRGEKVGNSTYLGYLRGFWLNNFEDEFNELTTGKPSEKQDEKRIGSIEEFFTNLVEKAEEVFKVGR